MAAIFKIWDAYISPAVDEGMDIGSSALRFKDLYLSGTMTLTGATISGNMTVSAAYKIIFRDADIFINSGDDGHLDLAADTSIDFNVNGNGQIILADGKLYPVTDSDVDLGDSTHCFKDLYIDTIASNVTCTGRFIVRTLAEDPGVNLVAGSTGEIASWNSRLWYCTNGTTMNWELVAWEAYESHSPSASPSSSESGSPSESISSSPSSSPS